MGKIKVHEKALAHLSRGLYRSPASAIRELVSNAWDAGATAVRIGTNYPLFYQLSIEDNGVGFTEDDFRRLMEGGVGNSEKRSVAELEAPAYGRPVIGRLGIGLLGIAQICGTFNIVSKPRTGQGFKAHVRLYDLLKERLDRDDSEIVKEIGVSEQSAVSVPGEGDRETNGEGEAQTITEVDIGEYSFEEYDETKYKHGTLIISEDVHPTFVETFQKSLKFEKFKKPPLEWSKALRIAQSVHSLQELGDYWRLLWELAASCPIPYASEQALPHKLIAEEQAKLEGYRFKLVVDGIQLFKPVKLRGNPGGYTTRVIEPQHIKIYGKDLRFHGYVLVQDGLSIRPDELRGILIRIKNVSIGYYDPSMLDYRFNEGPRSRWLTGEILVDSGLEDALNIDRDSFNRFHPQFRAIQKYVHELLHDEVFPEVYRKIEDRSLDREISKEEGRSERLGGVISRAGHAPVRMRVKARPSGSDLPAAEVHVKSNAVEVSVPDPVRLETKRAHRQLASAVLAIYEVSLQERTREKQRATFTMLLLDLLSSW